MKKSLHRLCLSFSFFLFTFSLHSQWVSIPDTNFGTFLKGNYPSCIQGSYQTGWQMDTTCQAVINAVKINCNYWNIKNLWGVQYFDNLDTLNCYNDQLVGLPALPGNLTYLNCSSNQLDSLPALPASLMLLDCSNNYLIRLPSLPGGLINLNCSQNQLSTLPNLPSGLTDLNCSDNQLISLPVLSAGLISLSCYNNILSGLPSLSSGLTELRCSGNQLSSLPNLPSGLILLDCSDNQINSLPALPSGLKTLWCFVNRLHNLPNLSDSLIYLYCSINQLNSLPTLPSGLAYLNCTGNHLTSLPDLPSGLTQVYCSSNQLNSLPALPHLLGNLYVDNNPLSCFPRITQIVNLEFSGTNIMCLPNYGNVTNSNPSLNSIPICDLFNTNGCEVYWNISGKVYIDKDSNCIQNSSDNGLVNIPVKLWRNDSLIQQTYTHGLGSYSFDTDSFDTYTVSIDTSNTPYEILCPGNDLDTAVVTVLDSLLYNKDFAIRCKQGYDLAVWSVVNLNGIIHPAIYNTVQISAGELSQFYGLHCAIGVSGQVIVNISGPVLYISPAPGALTPVVSGNTLTYNIADFATVNPLTDFRIILHTDSTAQMEDMVCITAYVTPEIGDFNPLNNALSNCFAVGASHDPNNKEVYPIADIDTSEHWLTYTINFQNTGTDTAQHIYITDTLDSNVDASTFQLLAYSKQPLVQIKENAVRFNFPNINLVDSGTNEPLSHGYVQYKVKLKDNLPIGTQMNNTAFIYFDFNSPVITNTTTNTITTVTAVSPLSFGEGPGVRIYPNPANNSVTISVDEGLVGSIAIVSDITGRKLAAVQLNTNHQSLITSMLASGVYFVTLNTPQGNHITKKLVIE